MKIGVDRGTTVADTRGFMVDLHMLIPATSLLQVTGLEVPLRKCARIARVSSQAFALLVVFVAAVWAPATQSATLAAGTRHNLVLRDDGTVWAFGNNAFGQLGDGTTTNRASPVLVLSGVRAIAAGEEHSLALKADGTLWAWGTNGRGQLGDANWSSFRGTPAPVMSGIRAVAAGGYHSLALRNDGTVWEWGSLLNASPAAPAQVLSGAVAVAAGGDVSMAIKGDGTLWVWGDNRNGQVGDGTTITRNAPVLVMGGVQATVSGGLHSFARKIDGTLWGWGANGSGQLGDGTSVDRYLPVRVMDGVQAVTAGTFHSLAITSDGRAWSWGANFKGELGTGGSPSASNIPVPVMTGVQAIGAGLFSSSAVKTDGTLWAWGTNSHGQLGDGSTVSRAGPVPVLSGVQAVAAGGNQSLALKSDGSVVGWGVRPPSPSGDGLDATYATPVPILNGVRVIAAGTSHALAIKADDTLWGWGANYHGQLGDGSNIDRETPVPLLGGVRAVAAGDWHSLALKADGIVWAWGANYAGQVGDGTNIDRYAPVPVLSGVKAIASGPYHSLALKTDGTLWTWGHNGLGGLGDGTTTYRNAPVNVLSGVKAIAAGGIYTLALKVDGTLWAWGDNRFGQLGDSFAVYRTTPGLVPLAGVQAIAAGGDSSFAIKADGTLWGWGRLAVAGSGGGQGVPQKSPFVRDVVGVAAGASHVLALIADGRVLAWGGNALQQLGIARLFESNVPSAVRDPAGPYAGAIPVVEYFNPSIRNGAGTAGIGHYFITAVPAEVASIDAGGSGPGWSRTGRTFRAWNNPAGAPTGAAGVCRFYARVPNSHFYTGDAAECQSLRAMNPGNDPNLGWSYEGIAFYTVPPAGAGCGAGYHPVYRSYNNRFNANPALNDGNHRITPSYNDYQRSIRFFGYADEGIAFCSPVSANPGGDLQATYTFPGASVEAGSPITAEFLFGNNGAGNGDGGSIFLALPAEVTNWSVNCTPRNGAACPSTTDLDRLREGQAIASWPAGGTLTLLATGTAPQAAGGGDTALNFAATVASASGSPDANPANDTPPLGQTVVKSATVCNYVVNPTALVLGPAAQSPHVNLVAGNNCAWSAQSSAPWLTVSPGSGTGDANLTLALAANTTITERTGSATLNGQTIVVTQAGVPCTFTASPATLAFTPAAQTAVVALASPAGCNWTAQSSASWLAISPAGGSGNASLTISIQDNTAAVARDGSIVLGNLTIPVAQSGVTEVASLPTPADPCATFRLQREGDQVASRGFTGAQSFDVIADGRCTWSARSNTSWITLTAGAGGSGNGTVRYKVDEYNDLQVRNGSITVGVKLFTINQLGNIATDNNSDGGDGGSGGGGGGSGGGSG